MDNSYFDTMDKSKCSGCRACEQICDFGAIKMECDEEGFLYPQIDSGQCRNCGRCHKICPVANEPSKSEVKRVCALQYKNEEDLKKSSSGGVFIGIAKKIIEKGGIVFGCVFDENHKAVIRETENEEMLQKMQGSKYVSSNTESTYSAVKNYLQNGKTVFYTGAPCQVAGLISFLGKKYENLYTMDFLCHGMPSGKVFEENIKYLEEKYGGKISGYQFRDKSLKGWGHTSSFIINGKKMYEPGKVNAYFTGFINGYLNRYSCYSCAFRGIKRVADITVGDFWGYEDNKISSSKGVSFVAVNTDKGQKLFDEIIENDYITESSMTEKVARANGTLLSQKSEKVPEIRKSIYKELNEAGYSMIRKKYLIPKHYMLLKAGSKIPQNIRTKLMKIYGRIK